jgi:hypothetical protein
VSSNMSPSGSDSDNDADSDDGTFSSSPPLHLEEFATSHSIRQHVKIMWSKLTISEVSGSCGDFGTLVPLLVAMARQRSIYLAPTLFGTGLVHVVTGCLWDIPMPLQPMKSIAAVAIAEGLTRTQVTTAGMWMGISMTLLSFGGIEAVNKVVPKSVVSGLQMGVGLRLATKGMVMIQHLTWWGTMDCITLAVVCSLLCLYWLRERSPANPNTSHRNGQESLCQRLSQKPPIGLYLFGLGSILAAIQLATTTTSKDENSIPWLFGEPVITNALHNVTWEDWKIGLLEGAIPQLPLTTLNSVISVCLLAHTLFPDKRNAASTSDGDAVVSRKHVCLSVGLLNLVLCPMGCMPNCHGAGGLVGQHRLGAESGVSMVALGIFKMIIAIVLGGSLLTLMDALPVAILGVLLVVSAHELATTGLSVLVNSASDGRPGSLRQATVIAMIVTMVIVGLGKTHYGALCGWVAHMIYGNGVQEMVAWWHGGQQNREHLSEEQAYDPLSTSTGENPDTARETSCSM